MGVLNSCAPKLLFHAGLAAGSTAERLSLFVSEGKRATSGSCGHGGPQLCHLLCPCSVPDVRVKSAVLLLTLGRESSFCESSGGSCSCRCIWSISLEISSLGCSRIRGLEAEEWCVGANNNSGNENVISLPLSSKTIGIRKPWKSSLVVGNLRSEIQCPGGELIEIFRRQVN